MKADRQKIKILFSVTDFAVAGAQRLIADELNHLDGSRYELALLTLFSLDGKNTLFDLIPAHVKVYQLDFKSFRDLRNWFRVFKVLREYRPAIILSHLFFSNTVLRVLKPFFRYRIIVYEHNTYINKTKWQKLADKILSYLTYKIVAVAQTVKDFTARQEGINGQKFVVIPDSINYQAIRAAIGGRPQAELKQKLGLNQEDKFVINAARLNWQKNQRLLIDSFAEFGAKNSGYKLIILGEGPQLSSLQAHAETLHIGGKVLLLGCQRNVFDYLAAAEFFVLTSKIEGFGIACIEAMAAGLPVVSTNVAGPDEYIVDGFNGYLVKSEGKKEIAAAMQKIVERGRDYFSENCRKTAERYDIKQHLEKLTTLIDQAL